MYPVEFVRQGGRKNYAMLVGSMSTLRGLRGTPASTPMDTMKPNAAMGTMIGGLFAGVVARGTGLVLRVESDVDMGGRGQTMHRAIRFDDANVRPPT